MSLEMKIGDVLLFKGKGIISKLIQKFTHSPYSHAAIYYKDNLLIESDWGGVQTSGISTKYHDADYDVFRYDKKVSMKQKKNALRFAKSQLGKGYDYGGLLGIGFDILFHKKRNPFDSKIKYWCSELVADSYLNARIKTDFRPETYKVSPGDIANSKYFKKVK